MQEYGLMQVVSQASFSVELLIIYYAAAYAEMTSIQDNQGNPAAVRS
jgi:hypothetical protein